MSPRSRPAVAGRMVKTRWPQVIRTPESLEHAQGWHGCTWRTLCRRLGLEGSVVGRLAELNIHLEIAETEDEARSIWTRQNNPMPVHPQRWKYS